MPSYTYPGVYIEEQPATGPIAGVGTSVVAFIGPAEKGLINVPVKITNRSQFVDQFGGYIMTPRVYLAHAVDGFFRNGGTVAYIVRVATAARATLDLADRGGGAGVAITVSAVEEGTAGNSLSAQVQDAQIVAAAAVAKPEATVQNAANDQITVTSATDAANFQPGDIVTIEATAERVTVDRVRGADIFLTSTLAASHNAGTLRIADLMATQTTFRLVSAAGLEAGSAITIAQGATSEETVVSAVTGNLVTVSPALNNGYTLAAADAAVTVVSHEFNLIIRGPSQPDEVFSNLAMDPRHSRFFRRIVDSVSVEVALPLVPSTELPPDNRPAVLAQTNLAGGTADNVNNINSGHYQTALAALTKIDDVNLVATPDRTDATVQTAVRDHCTAMADRFAILDSAFNLPPFGVGSVIDQRLAVESQAGFAAIYYPWIGVPDPQGTNGDLLMVPPSGHIAGIYARSDNTRGVHKAPANEPIRGALMVERRLDNIEHGQVNIEGINVIRVFPNQAVPKVMGARTTVPKAEVPWRYVNVRRLLLFIEESIEEGIQWAVFEPNNLALWEKLKRTISEFLYRVWRDGALFGATAEEAFYVKCDEELNPASLRAQGQVIVEIGVAPVRPAEFVIIRIGQWEGGASVTEG